MVSTFANRHSEIEKLKQGKIYIPSKSASETSSLVTFNARRRMAIFWDFFESSIRFSSTTEGRTNFLVVSLGTEVTELHPNSDSMAPSFNLCAHK